MITLCELEKFVKEYETKDFIKDDPIQFPHRYINKEDIEISGFITSLFSYGKRELFTKVLNKLFLQMNNQPFNFIQNSEFFLDKIHNIDYRFSRNIDILQIMFILNKLYFKEKSSLEGLFKYGWEQSQDICKMMQVVTDYFYSNITLNVTDGFYHLIPNPNKKSPLKRMNMFLRWMVRDGKVDFGIWHFIDKADLLIPLDVHVARISRELNLLKRNSNDIKAVVELTNNLKLFDANDPTKFDFALFGYGVNKIH